MSFQVSDKVVLVDDSPRPRPERVPQPHVPKGQTFTKLGGVYAVCSVWASPIDGEQLIALVGVPDYYTTNGLKVGFGAYRFRKLSEIQAENALHLSATAPEEAKGRPAAAEEPDCAGRGLDCPGKPSQTLNA